MRSLQALANRPLGSKDAMAVPALKAAPFDRPPIPAQRSVARVTADSAHAASIL